MTTSRIFIAAILALSFSATAPAFARNHGGGGGGGGDGPAGAAAPSDTRVNNNGCYRPGDRLTIDWQGLTEFDGQIAVVTEDGQTVLDVTSWNQRVVMVRLGSIESGVTYPVIYTTAGGVQAVMGELRSCSI